MSSTPWDSMGCEMVECHELENILKNMCDCSDSCVFEHLGPVPHKFHGQVGSQFLLADIGHEGLFFEKRPKKIEMCPAPFIKSLRDFLLVPPFETKRTLFFTPNLSGSKLENPSLPFTLPGERRTG